MARIALLAALCLLACAACGGGRRSPAELHTLPGVVPPRVQVAIGALSPVHDLVFLASKSAGKAHPGGPLIVDDKGRVVWFHQVPRKVTVTDFRVQTYRGEPVLTWWEGFDDKSGVGFGEDVIYDTAYRQIATVRAGEGLSADLHEFRLTPRGTAFITAYREVPYDLSGVGGPKKSYVDDCVVQEIDIATGKVVFSWHSLGNVPLSESLDAHREPARNASKKRPFDYFHVNSVSDGPNGTILVSARNTSTLYLLARDGHIVWRLGAHGDFGPKAAVRFFYQHDAHFLPDGTLSVFDNGGIPRVEKASRPVVLRLDEKTKRARIVRTFAPASPIASPYEGNLQLLPGGGAFVDWGGIPLLTDFDVHGRVVFQLKLPFGDTYRAYLEPWSGDPGGRPLAALSGSTAYASWNGKVGIARWQVLGGKDGGHLRQIATAGWSGLETAIPLRSKPKAIAVRAIGANGRVLGRSETVTH